MLPIKPRSKKAQWATFLAGLLCILIGSYFSETTNMIYALTLNISVYIVILGLCEIIQRICLLYEEFLHIPTRYSNVTELMLNTFQFSPPFLFTFVPCVFMVICFGLIYGNPLRLILELGVWCFYLSLFAVLLWTPLLKLKHGALYQSLYIGNLDGLDYGSSMACSFFHGYLEIVLPNKGNEQKGLKELMQDYAAKEQIVFDYLKLIVLIPLSLFCPATVSEKSQIIEGSKPLPKLEINRAGVNKRSYHCSPYKIYDRSKSKKVYACVEYATPLLTLYNAIKHNNRYADVYSTHRKELALQFYLSLQNILNNDPDCKDCCDLILFDDKDQNGEFVDVGEIVLEHLHNKEKKIV